MSPATTQSVWYVYGIVPEDTPMSSPPAGIDDSAVVIERHAGVAALVSVLDDPSYAPSVIEVNSGDVEWLSPRAVAHDRVLTWASDHAAVIPLPMFSLFSSARAVDDMLSDRSSQIAGTLTRIGRGREYALRVYRIDAELLSAVASLSPRLATMASTAAAASPGQRYLLERKLEGEKKNEVRAVTQRIVEEIMDALSQHAACAARSPIPRAADGDAAARGTMVLNAAFLVSPVALEPFQRMLTELVERHGPHGLRFDFTGPWPPYHFVNESTDGG
jgi:hypothetical protein